MTTILYTPRVREHMDAIASIFDGWSSKVTWENKALVWYEWQNAERRLSYLTTQACNTADEMYTTFIKQIEEDCKNKWATYFNNPEKFKKLFFVNTDPRGMQLKLNTTNSNEHLIKGIRYDWGKYIIFIDESINL